MSLSENLNESVWVYSNVYPSQESLERMIRYDFTEPQFRLTQEILTGGCNIASVEEASKFLFEREIRLTKSNKNEDYMPYCSSGWHQEKDRFSFWYQSTSGTILISSFEGYQSHFMVFLPQHRQGGYHSLLLDSIKAGMTAKQYHRWYNAVLENDLTRYQENVDWHTENLVPLGYERMPSAEEIYCKRQARLQFADPTETESQ